LLKKTVEKLTPALGFAPVESKGKLIQLVTSVDPAHSTLGYEQDKRKIGT
jgi:hypothetical protein